jgi:hypothetical protein
MSDPGSENGAESEEHKTLQLLQKGWDNARELIRQENDLVNHRLTGWLSIQGLLFTGLVLCTVSLAEDSGAYYKCTVSTIILIVSFVGFKTCLLIEPAIRAAYRHVSATSAWWRHFEKDPAYRGNHPFPLIVGKFADQRRLKSIWAPNLGDDEKYDGMDFNDVDFKSIGTPRLVGIPNLIVLFMWIWIGLMFMYSLVFLYFIITNSRQLSWPSRTVSETAFTIRKDSGGEDVVVRFRGDIERVDDLERLIGAIRAAARKEIPAPSSKSSQSN